MLRKTKRMVPEIGEKGPTGKLVEMAVSVQPCIRPGLSLVYIPDLGQRNADGGYKTPEEFTGSIQLPKGSLSWWLGGDPRVSDGEEVDIGTPGTDDR